MKPLEQLTDDELITALGMNRALNPPAPKQRMRTVAQGASLGWSEEIEAGIRSMIGDESYSQIRDELREKLRAYAEQNGAEAITLEIAGAMLPSLLMRRPSGAPGIKSLAKEGLVEGGIAGAGYSEGDDLSDVLRSGAVGSTVGAFAGPFAGKAIEKGVGLVSGLVDWTAKKLGVRASDAVREELKRLQAQTGKSTEEIILDLQEGRLMSENRTLMAALKNYVTEGGESGNAVLSQIQQRAGMRQNQALSDLQKHLDPTNADPNVLRSQMAKVSAEKEFENSLYSDLWRMYPEVDEDLAGATLDAVQRVPEARQALDKIYSARNIVPLFGTDPAGATYLARVPSLEDVEIVRRVLDNQTTSLYKNSAGTLGEATGEVARNLRDKLDSFSPELKATRAAAADVRNNRDAFDLGRRALTMNADELAVLMESMTPGAKNSLKQGLMVQIGDRVRRTGTTIANLADEDKQMGIILRTVLDGDDISRLEKTLSVAGEVKEMASKMPPTAGSQTNPLQRERRASGMGITADQMVGAARGDINSIGSVIMNIINRRSPGLTDKERMQVIETLFSEDPKVLMKALNDTGDIGAVLQLVDRAVARVTPATSRAVTQQSVQAVDPTIQTIYDQVFGAN